MTFRSLRNYLNTRNLLVLATEMFKVKNGITPPLQEEIFHIANLNYNLRNKRKLKSHNVKKSLLVQSPWLFF